MVAPMDVMIMALEERGFKPQVSYKNGQMRVRLDYNGSTHEAIGRTVEESIFLVLTKMVESLDKYLDQAEEDARKFKHELHRRGYVYNLLDIDEMTEMRNTYLKENGVEWQPNVRA